MVLIALLTLSSTQFDAPEKQIEFADYLFQKEDYWRATGEYERYLFFNSKGSGRKWALYRLGLCYERRGFYTDGIGYYNQLRHPEAIYRIGCSYFQLRNCDAGIRMLERIPAVSQASYRATSLKAVSLMMSQKWDQAEMALKLSAIALILLTSLH